MSFYFIMSRYHSLRLLLSAVGCKKNNKKNIFCNCGDDNEDNGMSVGIFLLFPLSTFILSRILSCFSTAPPSIFFWLSLVLSLSLFLILRKKVEWEPTIIFCGMKFNTKKSERNVLRAARKQMLMSISFSYQFQNYGNNFFFLVCTYNSCTEFFPFSFAFCWIATRIFLLSFSHVRLLYFLYLCTKIFILMDEMCSPCADECWATLCIYMNVFYSRSF